MDSFIQYGQLPQINVPDEDFSMNPGCDWPYNSYQDYYQYSADRQSVPRTVTGFGENLPWPPNKLQQMSSMQRFIYDEQRPLFNPGYLQTDLPRSVRSPHSHRRELDRSCETHSPFPNPDEYQRHGSPEGTIWSASSGTHSAYPSDELRSAGQSPRCSLSSNQSDTGPRGVSYLELSLYSPYSKDMSYGTASLIDIQGVPDPDMAQSVEEDIKVEQPYGYPTPVNMATESFKQEPDDWHSRDAESVQPCFKELEDPADPDYDPTSPRVKRQRTVSNSSQSSTRSNKRPSSPRKHSNGSNCTIGTHKVNKKRRTSSTASAIAPDAANVNANQYRPFPCPLALYGCASTFTSKNEWKRHVSTQHIRLGFWRCDLCPTQPDSNGRPSSHNDFNRKDLFTQHLRRMHSPPQNKSNEKKGSASPSRDYPVTESNISEHQQRCYKRLREPPARSSCLFCNRTFEGKGSWEERMEHVGRHFEKDRKAASQNAHAIVKAEDWHDDEELRAWLVEEGLVECDGHGGWRIGDGVPRRQHLDERDGDGEEE